MHTNAGRIGRLLGLLALLVAGSAGAAATRGDCDGAAFATTLAAVRPGVPADARAAWLDRSRIRWPGVAAQGRFVLYGADRATLEASPGAPVRGFDHRLDLVVDASALAADIAARHAWRGAGVQLAVADAGAVDRLVSAQVLIVQEDAAGRVQQATHLQWAGHHDDRFAAAEAEPALGAHTDGQATTFRLFAPGAQAVALCLYASAQGSATGLSPLARDPATGIWSVTEPADLHGRFYTYLVDVAVRGVGIVRNRVTDPYAFGLSANSRRAAVLDLSRPDTQPPGWGARAKGAGKRLGPERATDLVLYELHVRDFSVTDTSVPEAHRGKYLAFAASESHGMRHLASLAEAGLTDVHLLPVFDLATVPEQGCVTPVVTGSGDSPAPQAAVVATRNEDCFNWGYDPFHFTAPEGSYATDPDDAAARVREFRAMVQGLARIGLRVGMDVVYNHTSASGQDPRSVLDRIVPDYYHRLDARGDVTTSTCCRNTATEHRMMAKLMIDSAVTWARDHHIASFRFDLMGHQPREAMLRLQAAVNAATGRHVALLGEGWNFGEVANGARFVQASQLSLPGTGIGTFSDRARDAVRGGSPMDSDSRLVAAQGFVNGLNYDRNAQGQGTRADLLRAADLVRVGLAGSLRDYRMTDARGRTVRLSEIDYGGQPAGYVAEPGEVVNYVENHDNQTLFDINAFKLPTTTSAEDRARVQVLALAITAFSQGTAYFHAGGELLRSKSMDRNSFDSGDWFNRIDWTATDNHFGTGLPPQPENGNAWAWMRPLLANPAIRPEPRHIRFTRDAFRDLLAIRRSTALFRLPTAAEVSARLSFANTGPDQVPTLLVGRLDGAGLDASPFRKLAYFINVDRQPATFVLPDTVAQDWVLHPVQRDRDAADARIRKDARFDADRGRFDIPPRSAVVFVLESP